MRIASLQFRGTNPFDVHVVASHSAHDHLPVIMEMMHLLVRGQCGDQNSASEDVNSFHKPGFEVSNSLRIGR